MTAMKRHLCINVIVDVRGMNVNMPCWRQINVGSSYAERQRRTVVMSKRKFFPRDALKARKGEKGSLNFRLFRVFSGQSFFPILLLFMPFAEKFAPHGINLGLEDIR